MPATTTTPPVPSYWNGRPIVAAVKIDPGPHALFVHQWIAVTEEPGGTQFTVHEFVWTGSHAPRIGSVPVEGLTYTQAIQHMIEEAKIPGA